MIRELLTSLPPLAAHCLCGALLALCLAGYAGLALRSIAREETARDWDFEVWE